MSNVQQDEPVNTSSVQDGLSVCRVSKRFETAAETLHILEDVNLELKPGEDLSIVGPSGCGKSTLLYILGTLDTPSEGTVQLSGKFPFELSPRELAEFRNANIGFVFQDHHLLPQLSVVENVLLPAMAKGSPSRQQIDRALELTSLVGLDERREHTPNQLSGGERQRVAVARALLNQPRLLLADEPTGNLDSATTQTIAELLFELPQRESTTLIVVTHSEWVAGQASRQMRLEDRQLHSVS